MMALTRLIGLAGVMALVPACADDGGCDEPLEVCDIGSAECREHVFIQTACARGHTGRTVPPVLSITRSEFEDLLRAGDEPTAEQQRQDAQIAGALRMLSLLPPGQTSSEEAAIAAYAAAVLAFYTREDRTVTIIETNLGDVDLETSLFVLSHEFVHAQQDVDVGLQDFFDEHATSSDASTAVRSITEGDAVHYSNLTMARQAGASITPEIFDAYYGDQQQGLRDAAAGSTETGYTDLSSSFPYPFGGELVTDAWFRGGNEAALAFYDAPPGSTGAILRTLEGDDPRDEIDLPSVTADPLPEGWTVVADDTLGAWIFHVLAVRNGMTSDEAYALARDWAGDRAVVVGGPADDDVAVAWTVRFFSEASALQLMRMQSIAPPEGVRSVQVEGRDVVMVFAADDDALTQWEDTFESAAHGAEVPGFRAAEARLAPPLPRPKRPHPPHGAL